MIAFHLDMLQGVVASCHANFNVLNEQSQSRCSLKCLGHVLKFHVGTLLRGEVVSLIPSCHNNFLSVTPDIQVYRSIGAVIGMLEPI